MRIPITTVLNNVSGGSTPYSLTSVTSQNNNDYVSISGGNVLFAPSNTNAASTLNYYVQDASGNTGNGIFTVGVTNAVGTQAIQYSVSGSSVTITCSGIPGFKYSVQRTTSLVSPITWTDLPGSTTTVPANGIWTFTDASAPNGQAYYRTIQANP
jgi:hypothetical protein